MTLIKKYRDIFRFLLIFAISNVLIFLILGSKYFYYILSSETLFETSAYTYQSLGAKIFVIAIHLCTYLGHFGLLALLPCIILIPSIFIFPRRFIFVLAVFLWAFSALFLIADNILFSFFNFHINYMVLNLILSGDYPILKFLEPSKLEIMLSLIVITFILLIESLLAIVVWKKIILTKKRFFELTILTSLGSCLGISYLIFILSITNNNNVFALQTPILPLYNNILASVLPIKNSFSTITRFTESHFSQPLFPISKLNYPLHKLNYFKMIKNENQNKNILIIVVDTWRFDTFNKKLTPYLHDFANKAWQFKNHMSGGNSTQAGIFSLFYGLPANYWGATRNEKQSPLFIDELLKRGYQTKILMSSDMTPPFQFNIFNKIPNLRIKQSPGDTIDERDRSITKEFQQFIYKRNKQRPFFAFLFYDAVHGCYQTLHIPAVYPVNDYTERLTRLISSSDALTDTKNRYKNAVIFVANQIKEVVDTLTKENLINNTIIIITSDHGEEFNDNHKGYIGHGSNYSQYQLHVPFIVKWPGKEPREFTHLTTHYDLIPTLMTDTLGCSNPIRDYSIGKHLLNTNPLSYFLVGSYVNMGMVEKNKITTLLTTGNIQLTDTNLNDMLITELNKSALSDALFQMRLYYKR